MRKCSKPLATPAVKFMHSLPALHNHNHNHNHDTDAGQRIYSRRGIDELEVTEEVFKSPASIVFDQGENRLHTIKATMVATIGPA